MNKTIHKKIKYRNGETGFLLTTELPNTAFCVLTIRDLSGCIIHHNKDGKYLGRSGGTPLDIVWVEE
jgi:hypothetical protein